MGLFFGGLDRPGLGFRRFGLVPDAELSGGVSVPQQPEATYLAGVLYVSPKTRATVVSAYMDYAKGCLFYFYEWSLHAI